VQAGNCALCWDCESLTLQNAMSLLPLALMVFRLMLHDSSHFLVKSFHAQFLWAPSVARRRTAVWLNYQVAACKHARRHRRRTLLRKSLQIQF
jgi:hypothetical protein